MRPPVARRRAGAAIGLLVVLVLFCLPLFINLGGWDLRSDEAIYAYAVDRMLETGQWLTPRSIQVDGPFLEKPPLKLWLVAAGMYAGIVPHDEAGYRLLDAVMGAVAFLYIYAIGLRIAGPVCGGVAVLVTFSIDALVFEHGLRSHNMEAAVFLAYCGGVYHFMRWVDGWRAPLHALIVALFFVLGVMTKFVAALFLPVICLGATASVPLVRQRLIEGWRNWVAPLALAVVLIVPWFAYEAMAYGPGFWRVIFDEHVVTRFTGALDASHLQPWHYYFTEVWDDLAGSQVIVAIGIMALAQLAWRGQPWQMRLLLIWAIVPLTLISLGTSKLVHYAYPFVPPLAIAAGWVAARIISAAREPSADVLVAAARHLAIDGATWRRRLVRATLIAVALGAIAVAVATAVTGRVELHAGGVKLLQNSTVARPLLVAALLLGIAGRATMSVQTLAVLLVTLMLPVLTYPAKIRFATTVDAKLRTIRTCAERVGQDHPASSRGIFNTVRPLPSHSVYYYLYRLGEWTEPEAPQPVDLHRRLFEPEQQTPVLMTTAGYEQLRQLAAGKIIAALPPAVVVDGVTIVMPGNFSRCAAAARAAGAPAPVRGG